MKAKAHFNNLFKGKRNWNIVLTPSIGFSWENYGYFKVFMFYFMFLNVEFWIEIKWS